MGATEYVVKPFAPTELAARVRAALRRHELPEPPEHFVPGDLVVDYARRVVTPDGSLMRLTAIEYRTLAVLAANAGRETTYGAAAATGLGDGRGRRPAARAHRTGSPSPQAEGRRRQPGLHTHRAPGRVPHGLSRSCAAGGAKHPLSRFSCNSEMNSGISLLDGSNRPFRRIGQSSPHGFVLSQGFFFRVHGNVHWLASRSSFGSGSPGGAPV